MEPSLKLPEQFNTAEKVGFEPADRNKRVIAFLLDALIVGIASQLITIFLLKPLHLGPLALIFFRSLIPIALYWVGLTLQFGATPGKKIMGIRIVNVDGNVELGVGQLILRETVGRTLSILPLGLGYIWVSINKERRAWHDLIAKTRVVEYR